MTGSDRPKRPPLDLADVLEELGHTPESFARVVGRNASGLRRAIRGETKMTSSAAKDIAEGLRAEGWEGNLMTIRQLARALHRSATPGSDERLWGSPPRRTSFPGTQVTTALANLMHHLGREEVDRVYEVVFGARPNDKE